MGASIPLLPKEKRTGGGTMFGISINYVAVLIAAIAQMVVGSLWYSPMLFGKTWMKAAGKTEKDIKESNKAQLYTVSFIGALIMAFVLAHVVVLAAAITILDGIATGFWMWLGFVFTTSLINGIFESKPLRLYLVDNGYHLVSLALMGVVLALWG